MRHFSDNFIFGAATSAYQIEGAVNEGGRGPSIWDTFAHTPGKTLNGQHGDVACDHYHRWPEDLDLVAGLGASAYRFSLAWPRIIPQGRGAINQQGLDFYKRLVDGMLERGLTPWATLYHWDLPQPLQDKGGWPVRDTALAFADYARVCFDALGDRIQHWITLNEPWCIAILSHRLGEHAPGMHDAQAAVNTAHHINLAHGLAVQNFRASGKTGKIGPTLNPFVPRPATRSPQDIRAADLGANETRLFINPLFGKPYPQDYLDAWQVTVPLQAGDEAIMAQDVDFVGINYYNERLVRHDPDSVHGFEDLDTWHDATAMDWPITPGGLYRHLKWFMKEYPSIKEIYITENGAACDDVPNRDQNRVRDPQRIAYLREHFRVCLDAIDEGVPLKGYFAWSLLDNYEWAWGYSRRFGLVYVDYQDQRRIPKDSYKYYRDVIAGHEGF